MKFAIIAMTVLTLLGVAHASPGTDPVEPATDTKPTIQQLLNELGYDSILVDAKYEFGESGAESNAAYPFPFPLPFPGERYCENYTPPPGCTVQFNDGDFCTERCQPDEQILRVCSCSR